MVTNKQVIVTDLWMWRDRPHWCSKSKNLSFLWFSLFPSVILPLNGSHWPPRLEAATILSIATYSKLIWSMHINQSSRPTAELTPLCIPGPAIAINFYVGCLNPKALRVRPGPQKGPSPQNILPPTGRGVKSYLLRNERTIQNMKQDFSRIIHI